jgi:hypothetical protein
MPAPAGDSIDNDLFQFDVKNYPVTSYPDTVAVFSSQLFNIAFRRLLFQFVYRGGDTA